jgi:hypothetical protein
LWESLRGVEVVVVVQRKSLNLGQDVNGSRVVSLLESDFTSDGHRRNLGRLGTGRSIRVVVWLERRFHELERITRDSVSQIVLDSNLELWHRGVWVVENFTSGQVDKVVVHQKSPSGWSLSLERSGFNGVVWLKR